MFSSKKILYFIIVSLLVLCYANGIDYRSNSYADYIDGTGGEIVDFSDSGFFAANDYGSDVSVVAVPEDGGDGSNASDESSIDIGIESTTATESTAAPTDDANAPVTDPNNQITTTTTTRTTTTTTTTRTTTATTAAATTAERTYTDSGSMHFEYSSVRIYAGATTVIALSMPIGVQKLATFSSKDTSIATVRNASDTSVEITGVSVGTVWIQATNAERNYTAYCRVIVTDFSGEVLRLTNEQRANYGLSALSEGGSLVMKMANLRLSEIMQPNQFDHTRPNGNKFSTAAADVGLTYRKVGENLAYGQTTPSDVVTAWMDSPAHRANILDESFTQLSVAYGVRSDGRTFWVQIFYTPLN